jgi:hypothetical protein
MNVRRATSQLNRDLGRARSQIEHMQRNGTTLDWSLTWAEIGRSQQPVRDGIQQVSNKNLINLPMIHRIVLVRVLSAIHHFRFEDAWKHIEK